jgi:hypothetical protein
MVIFLNLCVTPRDSLFPPKGRDAQAITFHSVAEFPLSEA